MFLNSKMKNTIFITTVCSIIIVATMLILNSTAIQTTGTSDMSIIIDAGHGGVDGGADGIDGVLEKDLNLQIAKKLEKVIGENGGKAIMIRTEDVDLSDASANTIRQKKRTDLHNRRALGPQGKGDVYISIHQNKFEQQQYSGSQVFYANDKNSERLAGILQKNLINGLEQDGKRRIKQAYKTMFILQEVNIPSVIVECGFISNPEEAKLLSDNAYQESIARIIYQSIVEFMG